MSNPNGSWRGPIDSFKNWLGDTIAYLYKVMDRDDGGPRTPWTWLPITNYNLFCQGLPFADVVQRIPSDAWWNRLMRQRQSIRWLELGGRFLRTHPTPRYWCGPKKRLALIGSHDSSSADKLIARLIPSATCGVPFGREVHDMQLPVKLFFDERMTMEANLNWMNESIDWEIYELTAHARS